MSISDLFYKIVFRDDVVKSKDGIIVNADSAALAINIVRFLDVLRSYEANDLTHHQLQLRASADYILKDFHGMYNHGIVLDEVKDKLLTLIGHDVDTSLLWDEDSEVTHGLSMVAEDVLSVRDVNNQHAWVEVETSHYDEVFRMRALNVSLDLTVDAQTGVHGLAEFNN